MSTEKISSVKAPNNGQPVKAEWRKVGNSNFSDKAKVKAVAQPGEESGTVTGNGELVLSIPVKEGNIKHTVKPLVVKVIKEIEAGKSSVCYIADESTLQELANKLEEVATCNQQERQTRTINYFGFEVKVGCRNAKQHATGLDFKDAKKLANYEGQCWAGGEKIVESKLVPTTLYLEKTWKGVWFVLEDNGVELKTVKCTLRQGMELLDRIINADEWENSVENPTAWVTKEFKVIETAEEKEYKAEQAKLKEEEDRQNKVMAELEEMVKRLEEEAINKKLAEEYEAKKEEFKEQIKYGQDVLDKEKDKIRAIENLVGHQKYLDLNDRNNIMEFMEAVKAKDQVRQLQIVIKGSKEKAEFLWGMKSDVEGFIIQANLNMEQLRSILG